METVLDRIPEEALDAPVSGAHLQPGTLRDQLPKDQTVLLVFLRHFGCVFCRETVADLKQETERDSDFPPVLFFFMGSPTEGRVFLRRYWPDARAVADPEGRFYQAFGIGRGGVLRMLGPAVFAAKRRASKKGHEMGERSGDIWRMPGVFLARGGQIVWRHDFRHAGDLPDFSAVAGIARRQPGPV